MLPSPRHDAGKDDELPPLADIVAAFVSSQARKRVQGKESASPQATANPALLDTGIQRARTRTFQTPFPLGSHMPENPPVDMRIPPFFFSGPHEPPDEAPAAASRQQQPSRKSGSPQAAEHEFSSTFRSAFHSDASSSTKSAPLQTLMETETNGTIMPSRLALGKHTRAFVRVHAHTRYDCTIYILELSWPWPLP